MTRDATLDGTKKKYRRRCGFHSGLIARMEAKPINLTFWTPVCARCIRELGGSWRFRSMDPR